MKEESLFILIVYKKKIEEIILDMIKIVEENKEIFKFNEVINIFNYILKNEEYEYVYVFFNVDMEYFFLVVDVFDGNEFNIKIGYLRVIMF